MPENLCTSDDLAEYFSTVRSHHVALAALCLCLFGCPQKPPDTTNDEDNTIAGTCVVDDSRDSASPLAYDNAPMSGQICPRADVDWYSIDVPAGNDLLDLKVGFSTAVTRIDLQADLYASDGTTAVAGGQLVDDKLDDSQSNVSSTVRVTPGSFRLSVRDVGDDERDDLNQYTLTATPAKDPDSHEPNDTNATAKAADAQQGWFSFAGDVDVFKITIAAGTPILFVEIANNAASKAVVRYSLQDATGKELASGTAPPSATPLREQRALTTPGDYFVVLRQEASRAPDRRPEGAYLLTLTQKAEPDTNETTTRNDDAANATCLGSGGCASGFNGSADVALTQKQGFVTTTGDRDFYRFDLASGAPATIEINLTQPTPAGTQIAFDLLVPDMNSACATDGDCDSLNTACTDDFDCELSHVCLPPGAYHFCPAGQSCRRCVGGGACVPSGVGQAKVCAAAAFSSQIPPTVANMSGSSILHTAQPLFTAGSYFISVHDFQGNEYDDARAYTLTTKIWRELDPGDNAATAAQRNNFYNPYPLQTQSHAESANRAIDITNVIRGPTGVTGYISYQSDEDWYKFKYPCVNAQGQPVTCGIRFGWDQPASSKLRVVLLMRRDDLGIHESFVYEGSLDGLAHPGQTFGDLAASGGDCGECSFADYRHAGGDASYEYYLQIRDYGADDWEPQQPYHFSIIGLAGPNGITGVNGVTAGTGLAAGCPSACNYFAPNTNCACGCPGTLQCPGPPTF